MVGKGKERKGNETKRNETKGKERKGKEGRKTLIDNNPHKTQAAGEFSGYSAQMKSCLVGEEGPDSKSSSCFPADTT